MERGGTINFAYVERVYELIAGEIKSKSNRNQIQIKLKSNQIEIKSKSN